MAQNTDDKPPIPRKLFGFALIALVLAMFGTVIVMNYIGIFTDVEVMRKLARAYRIAYLPYRGPYNKIEPVIRQVAERLKKAEIKHTTPCALLLDDVSAVPESRRRAKVGYLVARNAYIPGSLEVENIAEREVLAASFRGSALVGSYKAYKAMRKWAAAKGYSLLLPALEIYHEDGRNEYQLGIRRKPAIGRRSESTRNQGE